jgi:hypothetical protein
MTQKSEDRPEKTEEQKLLEGYCGLNRANASNRRYLNVEPNISVKDSFTKDDYYGFRPNESVDGEAKKLMFKASEAYKSVGIIKQVIDLMGDFASQGIRIVHPNKSIERFSQRWFKKVHGVERSERFLNHLYKFGNVVVYVTYGKITKKEQKQMSKAAEKRVIPFKYDFMNPMNVEVSSTAGEIYSGNKKYKLRLSKSVKEGINSAEEYVKLDSQRLRVFHYKKDDWELWGLPMIHAVLDDITMLEKMKLADMAALDGAISNVRLWTIGNLEHKILPTRSAIDKLRDVLAANTGGGPMDLIWGPELAFSESNTQIYKFLGNEKYGPVFNALYGGIGIPQTMTGSSAANGGFTNNFLSLKTLIEKLEYGRSLLIEFWEQELKALSEAMGFPSAPEILFSDMILSDEAAEKNLWLQLYDRNIISAETLRGKFRESDDVEESRVNDEFKKRKKKKLPPKAGPYDKDSTDEFIKIALQQQRVKISDVTDLVERTPPKDPNAAPPGKPGQPSQKSVPNQNGRPLLKRDTGPRKQKRVLPRSKADFASCLVWASNAQNKISSILNPHFLSKFGKANMRQLTEAELFTIEEVKFMALCGLDLMREVNEESIKEALGLLRKIDMASFYEEFVRTHDRKPNIDEIRQLRCIAYSSQDFS